MTSISGHPNDSSTPARPGRDGRGARQFSDPGATFSAQANALEGMDSLEAYTDWMKGLITLLPDGRAEVRSFAVDEARNSVAATASSAGRTPGRAGRCRRPERARRPTTST